MEIENNKRGAGRGHMATLDEDLILSLAQIGCTYNEIADICQVNVSTLERRVKDIITLGHGTMKKSLRRKQLEVALKDGNPTMLIWLGKQSLDQRDNREIQHTGVDGKELLFNFIYHPEIIDVENTEPPQIEEDKNDDE